MFEYYNYLIYLCNMYSNSFINFENRLFYIMLLFAIRIFCLTLVRRGGSMGLLFLRNTLLLSGIADPTAQQSPSSSSQPQSHPTPPPSP